MDVVILRGRDIFDEHPLQEDQRRRDLLALVVVDQQGVVSEDVEPLLHRARFTPYF